MVDAAVLVVGSVVVSSADRNFRRVLWSVPCMDDPLLHNCAPWNFSEHLDDLLRIVWFADRDGMLPGWIPRTEIDYWEWQCRCVADESELSLIRCDWYNEKWHSTRRNDNKWQSQMMWLSQKIDLLGMKHLPHPINSTPGALGQRGRWSSAHSGLLTLRYSLCGRSMILGGYRIARPGCWKV